MIVVDDACLLCCSHRKAHSQPSMNWLSVLSKSNIHVLVCLTHADKLVAEAMPEAGVLPDPSASWKCVEETRQVCVCVCVCVLCIHMSVCAHICVQVCICVYMCACVYICGIHEL